MDKQVTPRGYCFLSYDTEHCFSNNTVVSMVAVSNLPIAMHCVQCKQSETETVLTTDPIATKFQSEDVPCQNLTFDLRDPRSAYPLNFTYYVPSGSAYDCAQSCYFANCTSAAFLPSKIAAGEGSCHFSFDAENCSSSSDNQPKDWSFYAHPVSLVMHCIRCENKHVSSNGSFPRLAFSSKYPNMPKSRILVHEEINSLSTLSSCKKLLFEPMDPEVDINLNFTQEIETDSADDCAKLCYNSNCVTVGYLPNEDVTVLRGVCFMSFEPDYCPLTAKRISSYPQRDPVVLRCITCDDRKKDDTDKIQMNMNSQKCKSLSFQPAEIDRDRSYNFTKRISSTSVKQCSELCYASDCTIAAFAVTHKSATKVEGVCHLSFHEEVCDSVAPRVYNFSRNFDSSSSTIIMRCLRCENDLDTGSRQRSHSPKMTRSVTSGPAVAFMSDAVTRKNFGSLPLCTRLTFEPRTPKADFSLTFAKDILSARSAGECAHQCYLNKCMFAGFMPKSNVASQGTCFFYFEEEKCNTTSIRVSTLTAYKPTLLHCIRCEDSIAVENAENLPIDEQAPRLTTPTQQPKKLNNELRSDQRSVAKFEASPDKNFQHCKHLSFEPTNPNSETVLNFTKDFPSKNPDECAQLCYSVNCVTAGFVPHDEPDLNSSGTCFLSFEDEICLLSNPKRVSSVGKVTLIVMHCVHCESAEMTSTSQSLHPQIASHACSDLSFEPGILYEDKWNFTSQVSASSANECAQMCFLSGCTSSAFILNAEALSKIVANLTRPSTGNDIGTCFFSFDDDICVAGRGNRVRNYLGSYPVAIRCIRCGELHRDAHGSTPQFCLCINALARMKRTSMF